MIFTILVLGNGFAQNKADSLLATDNKLIPLPTVNINVGFNHAFSDVALSKEGPTPFRQLGYQLTVVQRAAKFLNVGFDLYSGTIYGEEQRGTTNINYRTSLVSPRINVEYNFYPLLKPDIRGRQLIRPYVGFGVGMVIFRSKGDMKDESGNAYNYWQNGSIYAEAEGSIDESEATPLERDFEYETDLRDANLDGFRKYPQTVLSLPFNAGVRFQLSKNVGINAAFSYVMNFTDMLDNVSSESIGVRQGSSGFDNHLFGSIGLSVFLGTTKPSAKPKPSFEKELATTENPNSDESILEAVPETTEEEDDLQENQEASAVSSDSSQSQTSEEQSSGNDNAEGEGVSVSNIAVDENESESDSETEIDSENQEQTSGLASADVESVTVETESGKTNPPQLNIGDISETEPKKTGEYHWADLNQDEWISPNEVLHFIDLLFEGGAVRSVEDIQNLIDYYFDQD